MTRYKFIGTNSLGYIKGQVYELRFIPPIQGYEDCQITISRQDGSGVCPYTSKETFTANWKEVNL